MLDVLKTGRVAGTAKEEEGKRPQLSRLFKRVHLLCEARRSSLWCPSREWDTEGTSAAAPG